MKLFFFDIDGTIIDCVHQIYEPTEKTKRAFKELVDQGHKVYICSGRPIYFLNSTLKNELFSGYVNSNGAIIREDEKIIKKDVIPSSIVKRILELSRIYHFSPMFECSDKCYIANQFNECLKWFTFTYQIPSGVYEMIDQVDDLEVMKISIYFDDIENQDVSWVQEFPNFRPRFLGHGAFDLDSNKVTKGTAVSFLTEFHQVKDQDVYAFGDGENDIEMLEASFNSVAMGVANELVRSKAKFLTGTVEQEGVYNFLLEKELIDE